jgi:hypothetical protein
MMTGRLARPNSVEVPSAAGVPAALPSIGAMTAFYVQTETSATETASSGLAAIMPALRDRRHISARLPGCSPGPIRPVRAHPLAPGPRPGAVNRQQVQGPWSVCRLVAPAAARSASAATEPEPFAVISVPRFAPGRPEQARDDRLRPRLCQRDRAARQARRRPPRLPHPGSRRLVPPPAAQASGPIEQPPGGSCQRDPQRVGDPQHQEPAPAPRILDSYVAVICKPRDPRAQPGTPQNPMPTRLGRPGRRLGQDVPPERFTRHHDQRGQNHREQPDGSRPQELPHGTMTPHAFIVAQNREWRWPPNRIGTR